MRLATFIIAAAVSATLAGAVPSAGAIQEHVTGGALDLTWVPGFQVSNNLTAVTLGPVDAAFGNPSGDHTVGRLVNAMPDSGGIALAATDPRGLSDYLWEAWVFTGDGNSRRGLVVRADPSNGFASCYQFVLQAGLLQLNFRRLVNGAPTALATWFTTSTPGGLPQVNTWHHMRVSAEGASFRCFWDGFELTTTPIADASLPSGWVGVYNFRFDIGGIPFLVDDLVLTPRTVAVLPSSWTHLKNLYRGR